MDDALSWCLCLCLLYLYYSAYITRYSRLQRISRTQYHTYAVLPQCHSHTREIHHVLAGTAPYPPHNTMQLCRTSCNVAVASMELNLHQRQLYNHMDVPSARARRSSRSCSREHHFRLQTNSLFGDAALKVHDTHANGKEACFQPLPSPRHLSTHHEKIGV